MLWNASWFKRNEPSKKHHLSLGSVRAGSGHAECWHSAARSIAANIDKSSSNLMSVGSDALGLCDRHRRAARTRYRPAYRRTSKLTEKTSLAWQAVVFSVGGDRGRRSLDRYFICLT